MAHKKILRSVLFVFITGGILCMVDSCRPTDDQITKTVTNVAVAVAPKVAVNVQNGVVTLHGVIPDTMTKADLDTAIRKMKGVVALHDQTSIPPLPDSVIQQDKVIMQAIDSALRADHVPGVAVSVYNGVVTLTGNTTVENFKTIQRVVDHAHPRKVLNGLNIQ